jgi:hypothetical protein
MPTSDTVIKCEPPAHAPSWTSGGPGLTWTHMREKLSGEPFDPRRDVVSNRPSLFEWLGMLGLPDDHPGRHTEEYVQALAPLL